MRHPLFLSIAMLLVAVAPANAAVQSQSPGMRTAASSEASITRGACHEIRPGIFLC